MKSACFNIVVRRTVFFGCALFASDPVETFDSKVLKVKNRSKVETDGLDADTLAWFKSSSHLQIRFEILSAQGFWNGLKFKKRLFLFRTLREANVLLDVKRELPSIAKTWTDFKV